MDDYCEGCKADGKQAKATIILGDGLRLCADCWEDCKDDCEPIEQGALHK